MVQSPLFGICHLTPSFGAPPFIAVGDRIEADQRADDLAAAITPRTRWLLLNFPNSLAGTGCRREDLAEIAQVMLCHPDIWILTDDIYEHLLYDGFVFSTIAEVEPALKDQVLTMNGVSNAYAMTGWRLGYAGGPKTLINAMGNMQGQTTGGVCNLAQAGVIAAPGARRPGR